MHADLIVDATSSRRMPPWLPEHGYGEFFNARRLTDAQIAAIADWVRNGAPEGSASDLPPTPSWHEGWQLGAPDLVASLPEPYTLQPTDTDVFRNFVIPVDVPASRFARGVEFLPGSVPVVHHDVMGVDSTRMSRRMDAADPEPGYEGMFSAEFHSPDRHFVGWTPGRTGFLNPPDMSWQLELGIDLVVQVHMMPSQMPQRIGPRIGLFFTLTPSGRVPFMLKLTSTTIDIPPGETNCVVEDSYTLPDGSTRRLIWIRNWDFDWQDFYRYVAPVPLPSGTRIAMTFTYDNSGNNPRHHGCAGRRISTYSPPTTSADRSRQALPPRRRWCASGLTMRADATFSVLGISRVAARLRRSLSCMRRSSSTHRTWKRATTSAPLCSLPANQAKRSRTVRLAARSKPGDGRVHFNLGNALTT